MRTDSSAGRRRLRQASASAYLLGCLAVAAAAVLLVGALVASGYNRAVTLDEQVDSQWAQVENQLQRRYDLIPNLVETVKGITGQEEKIFLQLAEARKAYVNAASVPAKAEAAEGVESALARLLVLPENYPQLRSSESFLKLQDQLEGTENRLSVARMRYNDAVRELNTFRRRITGRFFAALAGVEAAEYFEIEEVAKQTPQVDFS